MGYLGKISGLIAISSGNSSSQIRAVGSEMKQFAATTQRALAQVSSDSVKSFGSIYTEVQKLERALQAASKLEFKGLKGFDGKSLGEASEQMRRIHEVAKGLSAPLGSVISTVEKMGDAIQQNLVAPMLAAQDAVEKVELKVAKGGVATATQFQNAKEKVLEFARAAEFASEAVAAASKISGGGGLKFQQPVLNREFDRGAALQAKVGAFPVLRMTKDVSALLDSQKQLADSAAQVAAAYGAMPTKETAADLQAATAAFQAVNDEINLLIVGYEKLDQQYADSKAAAVAAADAKIKAAEKEAERIRAIGIAAQSLQQAREYAATGEVQNIKQLTSAYDQLLARLRALPDADRAKVSAASGPSFSAVESAISSGDQANVASGASALAQIEVDILNTEKQITAAKEATATADKKATQDAAKAKSDAETLLRLEQARLQIMTGEAQSVSQLKSQYDSVLSRVEKLSAAQRASVQAVVDTNGAMVELAISSGADADVGAVKAEMAAIEGAVASAEDLDKQQKAAKKSADDLLGLQQGYAQSLSGQSQNIAQLRSTYDGLISRFEKLSAAQRATLAAGGFSTDSDKVRQTLASGDESKVAGTQAAIMSMEAAVSGAEDLDAKQKAAKKSADDLRNSLSKIGDSIGTPAAPIDQAREAIDRMNAAIDKIKDPAKKAKAAGIAAGIRKDIETEVAISAATGSAPAGSVISAAAKKANSLADAADAVNNRKTAKDIFGDVVGSRASQMDQVKSKIKGVQSELEKLPVTVQTKFAPELVKVRNLYMKLTPTSTRAEIEAAAKAAKLLGDSIQRTAQAQKFSGSFASFLDDTSAKKYEAELNAIQSKMAAVGATAGGPTAQAIGRYRDALEKAAMAGTLGSDATRENLQDLVDEIEKAIVAEGKLTAAKAKSIFGGIKREGDIGRGGADKFGLAVTQAAYAVDDFMSSTGGVEQKIRAISNNISQLGYIIGGTGGLIAAVGVTIAAQAAMFLYRFAAGGVAAEDSSKALNDSLEKQRNVVGELAAAYRDLAKSVVLSTDVQSGFDAASASSTVATANATARKTRLNGVDPAVVRQMAVQASIDRKMQSTSDVGTMLFLEEQRRWSQTTQSVAEGAARRRGTNQPINPGELEALRSKRTALAADAQEKQKTTLGLFGLEGLDPWYRAIAKDLAELEGKIRAAEDAFVGLGDRLAQGVVDASQQGRIRISAATSLLADAIAAGVPGARELQNSLDRISLDMAAAMARLADAAEIDDPKIRAREAGAAKSAMDAAAAQSQTAIAKTVEYSIKAAFAAPGSREVLGQLGNSGRASPVRAGLVRSGAMLDAAQSQLGASNAAVGAAAAEAIRVQSEGRRNIAPAEAAAESTKRWYEIAQASLDQGDARLEAAKAAWIAAETEFDTVKKAAAAANETADANVKAAEAARDKAQADFQAANEADKLAAAMGRAWTEVNEAVSRTRKIGEGALSASEQIADMRQKEYTERPTEENKRKRDEAEKRLIEDKRRESVLQTNLDKATDRASADESNKAIAEDIETRRRSIRLMQERAAATGVEPDMDAIRGMEVFIAGMEAVRAERIRRATAPEREEMDAFAQEQEQRRREAELEVRDRMTNGATRESKATERARVRQGREDAMTSRERRVLEAARSSENMAAAAGEFTNPAARQAFIQQYYANQKKEILQSGPLGQAADERFNAQFTTRRIGMDATDISTMEGSRELNRLLRGDDANKDVNFAEMQRQTELLSDIRDGIMASTGTPVIP